MQLLPPDVQFHRQLIAQNDSSLDVLLVVGVPGGLGGEKPRLVGPSRWSIYEKLLPGHAGLARARPLRGPASPRLRPRGR